MKYYLLRGEVREMEERLFKHLLPNEPEAVELTKKQYENYRDVKQKWPSGQDVKDASEPVGEDTAEKADTPFSGTRAEAIKILQQRGFQYKELRTKKLKELADML